MESIIVGAIILAAAAYAGYRLFVRRDCGCGKGSACESGVKQNGRSGPGCCCLSPENDGSGDGSESRR